MAASAEPDKVTLTVKAPNFLTLAVRIIGTAPYMQHAFPQKSRLQIQAKHEAGSTGSKGKKKEAAS